MYLPNHGLLKTGFSDLTGILVATLAGFPPIPSGMLTFD